MKCVIKNKILKITKKQLAKKNIFYYENRNDKREIRYFIHSNIILWAFTSNLSKLDES